MTWTSDTTARAATGWYEVKTAPFRGRHWFANLYHEPPPARLVYWQTRFCATAHEAECEAWAMVERACARRVQTGIGFAVYETPGL